MKLTFSDMLDFDAIENHSKPTLLFKHSTRCSISSMALSRLERDLENIQNVADVKLISVIDNREISNAIADRYQIQHESPQAILILNGKPRYNASHNSISAQSILDTINS